MKVTNTHVAEKAKNITHFLSTTMQSTSVVCCERRASGEYVPVLEATDSDEMHRLVPDGFLLNARSAYDWLDGFEKALKEFGTYQE